MSKTQESVINDLNDKSTAAYVNIENAVHELYYLGVPESAITLSVRIFYRDIEDETE